MTSAKGSCVGYVSWLLNIQAFAYMALTSIRRTLGWRCSVDVVEMADHRVNITDPEHSTASQAMTMGTHIVLRHPVYLLPPDAASSRGVSPVWIVKSSCLDLVSARLAYCGCCLDCQTLGGMNEWVGGVEWKRANVDMAIHFGGRFCQVSSRSCIFTSSLKWSNVDGPVPACTISLVKQLW
jgi:hypothetical protein